MKNAAEQIRSRVDRELLRKQINFLVNALSCSKSPDDADYLEGILSLLEWLYDLGWPPGSEEEDAA